MSKTTDTAEQVVVIGLGLGLLYGGFKLYKGIQNAAGALTAGDITKLPGAPAGVIPGNSKTYTTPGGVECHTDVGWFSQTEQCDAPPEPASVKASGRSARIKWGLDNANEHTVLDALKSPGRDLDQELEAFFWAGQRWQDHDPLALAKAGKSPEDGAPLGASNYDPDFFHRDRDAGQILLWWGSNRAGDPEVLQRLKDGGRLGPLTDDQAKALLSQVKESADKSDVAAVAKFAQGGVT